jgi:hypothetical protein
MPEMFLFLSKGESAVSDKRLHQRERQKNLTMKSIFLLIFSAFAATIGSGNAQEDLQCFVSGKEYFRKF